MVMCNYCGMEGLPQEDQDLLFYFLDGRAYRAPGLLFHYCLAHNFRPPDDFVQAVLGQAGRSPDPVRVNGREPAKPVPVGFLDGPPSYPFVWVDQSDQLKFLRELDRSRRWYAMIWKDCNDDH